LVLPEGRICQEPAANRLAFRNRFQVTGGLDPPIERGTIPLEDRAVVGIIGEVVDLVKISQGEKTAEVFLLSRAACISIVHTLLTQ